MKIERLSENQIRCTLNKKDLMDRQIRISEFAYGSAKAKELFQDMMEQASNQFGFEAEDIPLMIEAIPVSTESLILIITKMEDPDELDTRFSRFSPEPEASSDVPSEDELLYADEILNCFNQIGEILGEESEEYMVEDSEFTKPSIDIPSESNDTKYTKVQAGLTKFYSFHSLEDLSRLAERIAASYHGSNTIYKDSQEGRYYLLISKSDHSPNQFNKICNVISEYGRQERTTYASRSYFEEHFDTVISGNGIQVLAEIARGNL